MRNHGAAEWGACARAGKRKVRLDEKRRAIDVQRLVDRDRTAGRQWNSLGAERLSVFVQPDDTKKHHRAVLPAHVLGTIRIGLHPFADPLHRHFFARNDVVINQHSSDRHIRIAIVGIVVEAQHGAVFKPDPCRTLDLDEQRLCGAA